MFFSHFNSGYLVTIVEEDHGISDGGGTNTFGSYGTFYFDASEVFPDGVCNLSTKLCFSDGSVNRTFSFMLGHADAIAFIGCTPPEMRFFSHDVIINGRLTEEYPFFPGQNFGDTLSIRNVNVSSTTSIFDQPSVVIHSADGDVAEVVANAYVQGGVLQKSDVSIRGVSTETVRLWDRSGGKSWKESRPDILSFISRMTAPAGGMTDPAYLKYKTTPWPVYVYFAEDEQKPTAPLNPAIKPRSSVVSTDEVLMLKDSYKSLANLVINSFVKKMSATYITDQSLNLKKEGFYDSWDAILAKKNNDSWILPTRDATYGNPIFQSDEGLLYTQRTAVVVIGVLHSKVIGAAYSSAGVDVISAKTGQVSSTQWFLDADLEGSATRFFDEATVNCSDAELLFAFEVLPPGGCRSVDSTTAKWCVEFNATAATVATPIVSGGERIYSLESTGIGPDADKTLAAHLLIFNLPAE